MDTPKTKITIEIEGSKPHVIEGSLVQAMGDAEAHLREQFATVRRAHCTTVFVRRATGKLRPEDVCYAARSKCKTCDAGLAYVRDSNVHGQWECSAVIWGEVTEGEHEGYPFAFYKIKSEDQPSAGGATTRPPEHALPAIVDT